MYRQWVTRDDLGDPEFAAAVSDGRLFYRPPASLREFVAAPFSVAWGWELSSWLPP